MTRAILLSLEYLKYLVFQVLVYLGSALVKTIKDKS